VKPGDLASPQTPIGAMPSGGGMQHFWQAAGTMPPPRIAKAEGLNVWDTTGRRYLDCTSGPVAVNLGHGNPRVLAAMREQAARVCFAYPTSFESEPNLVLSERLAEAAGPGLDRAFFVSGGSEAIEKCLQFARLLAITRGETGRWKIIGRYPSYHGSTLAALSISGDLAAGVMQPYLLESPRVPAPLNYRIPDGLDADGHARHCLVALEQTIEREGPGSVLAFIMEPVIGLSGGAVCAPDFYYGEVRRICDRYGVLLIYDEVVSGGGRTGRFLAAHHWPAARPDLVVLAKGLGGGYYPLGAVLAPATMVAAVAGAAGFHYGHTHKGSPLGCAVGLAVLQETIDRGLMANAEASGAYLRERFTALMSSIPILGDVRGRGLLNAIEIVADQATKTMLPRELDVIGDIKAIALEKGLLIYGRRSHGGKFGDWLMMTPPLIATTADIDVIVDGIAAALGDYVRTLARQGHLA
jgi:adenosylmethionine-8-amino-7-oxononanoate aminotransferase